MQTSTQLKSRVILQHAREREHKIVVDLKINANCAVQDHTIADLQEFFDANKIRLAEWKLEVKR